ncbi:MAG: hypothetical protein COB35_04915 [Gammaproteobacteria bacterium]|nr:MAG: hypothetical protein COB35_04915 [Gammaproteobacteria bacterium]
MNPTYTITKTRIINPKSATCWLPHCFTNNNAFTPIFVRLRLSDVHVIAALQKKLNSNLYELLIPSQLFVLKRPQGAISND